MDIFTRMYKAGDLGKDKLTMREVGKIYGELTLYDLSIWLGWIGRVWPHFPSMKTSFIVMLDGKRWAGLSRLSWHKRAIT